MWETNMRYSSKFAKKQDYNESEDQNEKWFTKTELGQDMVTDILTIKYASVWWNGYVQ